jgi:AraC-like DNA-binding protein
MPARLPNSVSGAEILAESASETADRRLLEGFLRQGVFPLRHALEGVQISGWISPLETFDEPWVFAAPSAHHSFFGVAKGRCRVDACDNTPMRALRAGDLVIVKEGEAASLFDRVEDSIRGADPQRPGAPEVIRGIETKMISGGFIAGDGGSASFLAAFPPVLVVRGIRGQFLTWVDQLLGLMLDESSLNRPVSSDIVNRLLGILFIKVVRHVLEACEPGCERFFNTSTDPDVGIALVRIHERLDHPWTVGGLAKEAGLCRSTFAARFLLAVGKPPLQYLHNVRIQRASVLLHERSHSLEEIAAMTGYRTTSGFSAAFRRWTGKSPGEYRDANEAELRRSH